MQHRSVSVVLCLLWAVPLVVNAGKTKSMPAGPERAAVVSAILPNATLLRSSSPSDRADFGAELAWSDAIRTDGNGRVRLRLSDDSHVSIGNNSELKIVNRDQPAKRTVIQLAYGLLRARVAQDGETLQVRTPTAVADLLGDVGIDATTPGRVKFICLEGTVRISSSDPNLGSVECEAGETVTFKKGKAPYPPQTADVTLMGVWRNITDPEAQPQVQYFP